MSFNCIQKVNTKYPRLAQFPVFELFDVIKASLHFSASKEPAVEVNQSLDGGLYSLELEENSDSLVIRYVRDFYDLHLNKILLTDYQ